MVVDMMQMGRIGAAFEFRGVWSGWGTILCARWSGLCGTDFF